MKLLQLLHHENHFLPELQPDQRGTNELIVLVAVADHETLRIGMNGDGGNQLGLAAGLDSEMIGQPGIDDLLDHFAKLVDLDREDPPVFVSVVTLGNGLGKGFIEAAHPIPKQIMATHQERKTKPSGSRLTDEFHQINLLPIAAAGTHDGMACVVDFHISFGPSLHIVESGSLGGDGLGHF